VLGDYTSYELLTKSASEADIVIAMVGVSAETLKDLTILFFLAH
jgi:hypothetical protein